MSQQQACVDCRASSPLTETNYTLISSRHGWRLNRKRVSEGKFVMEWRCPSCWSRFKEENVGVLGSTPTVEKRDSPRAVFARATRRLLGRKSEPPPANE